MSQKKAARPFTTGQKPIKPPGRQTQAVSTAPGTSPLRLGPDSRCCAIMECVYLGSLVVLSLLQSAFAFTPRDHFAPKPKEVCFLQVDDGPCRADIERFYYNTITQRCEKFSYGGCAGNDNNFDSFLECQKTCFSIPKIPQICRFQKEEGTCRALIHRHFFNMTSMQCEPFFYGGCMGNDNNFQDYQSCMEYCRPPKSVPVICLEALDKGKCSASIPRYYYNSATKMCKEFLYTGCGGSNNNFVSKQSCMDVCARKGKSGKLRKNARLRKRI